jgi:hypothetical protein
LDYEHLMQNISRHRPNVKPSGNGAGPLREILAEACARGGYTMDELTVSEATASAETRLRQLQALTADRCPDVAQIALADIAREFPGASPS